MKELFFRHMIGDHGKGHASICDPGKDDKQEAAQ